MNDFQFVDRSSAPSAAVTVLVFTPFAPVPDQMPGTYTAGLEQIYTVRHKSLGPGEKLLVDDDFCEVVQALRAQELRHRTIPT